MGKRRLPQNDHAWRAELTDRQARFCEQYLIDLNATEAALRAAYGGKGQNRKSAREAVRSVWASRGKYVRAEPVSALYEQGRVHHAGSFAQLEGQLCSWVPDMDRAAMGSPDRGDALVWALTELMVDSDLGESRALFTSVQVGSPKRWPVYDPAHGWS